MQTSVETLLREKGSTVHCVSATATVLDAVRRMNNHKIGALLVEGDDGVTEGIITERDVMVRVVAAQRDPATTRVRETMTSSLVVISPDTTVEGAMSIMTEKRCRHLPVMNGHRLLGLVSIGDLTRWVLRDQKHEIEDLVHYVTG